MLRFGMKWALRGIKARHAPPRSARPPGRAGASEPWQSRVTVAVRCTMKRSAAVGRATAAHHRSPESEQMPHSIPRAAYAGMYGPTTGDRVRLADTDLVIEVERDLTTNGEEVKFGGGKVIRDGMGQSQTTRAEGAVDTVITNALIIDHQGIVKADVGLRDGLIAAVGTAGNPDTQDGVDIVSGPGTEVIAAEGR